MKKFKELSYTHHKNEICTIQKKKNFLHHLQKRHPIILEMEARTLRDGSMIFFSHLTEERLGSVETHCAYFFFMVYLEVFKYFLVFDTSFN